jgi:hypothetical protein
VSLQSLPPAPVVGELVAPPAPPSPPRLRPPVPVLTGPADDDRRQPAPLPLSADAGGHGRLVFPRCRKGRQASRDTLAPLAFAKYFLIPDRWEASQPASRTPTDGIQMQVTPCMLWVARRSALE